MRIGQRRAAAAPADAQLQPAALAIAAPVQVEHAPQPQPDVGEEPHARGEGTPATALPTPSLHPQAGTTPCAGVTAGSAARAHARSCLSANPVEAAGRQENGCSTNVQTTEQSRPDGGFSSRQRLGGLPATDAAAASCGAAEDPAAVVQAAVTPAGGVASLVVPMTSASVDTKAEVATAGVVEVSEGQQPRLQGLTAAAPAASTPLGVDALGTAANAAEARSPDADRCWAHPQTQTTAIKSALLAGNDIVLFGAALATADVPYAAMPVLQSPPASVSSAGAAPVTPAEISIACDVLPRASPQLFVTTQEWQCLLGSAPQTDDVVGVSDMVGEADVGVRGPRRHRCQYHQATGQTNENRVSAGYKQNHCAGLGKLRCRAISLRDMRIKHSS